MINRLLGVLFALATIAIVIFAIFNTGNYRSLCFNSVSEPEVTVEGATIESIPDTESIEDSTIIEPASEEVMPPAEAEADIESVANESTEI